MGQPAADPSAKTTGRKNGKRLWSEGITLADYVAEVCLICGLTMKAARRHSLAQLKLLQMTALKYRVKTSLEDLALISTAVNAGMSGQDKGLKTMQCELLSRIQQ
jgi:hypothetical protein